MQLRPHPKTKQLDDATAFQLNGKEFRVTLEVAYTVDSKQVDQLPHSTGVRKARESTPHVVLVKIRRYIMKSRPFSYALLATVSQPVELYVTSLSKVVWMLRCDGL